MSDSSAAPTVESVKTYRFMTNIIAEARHRTRYVKALEKFTMDAQVSFQRVIMSLGIGTVILLVAALLLVNSGRKFGYIVLPVLMCFFSLCVLLVVFLISSRNRSMLESVGGLLIFKNSEKLRKASSPYAGLYSMGIDKVENGIIYFTDGDVGLMYDVEGQMSYSVLPAVADAVSRVRHQYYIARPETVQEYLFTSVKRADVRDKLSSLKTIYDESQEHDDHFSKWIGYMSTINYNYIDQNMGKDETQLFQYLILRDVDLQSLKKSRQQFENSATAGMYAMVTLVTDTYEIARRLSDVTLLSTKGLEYYKVAPTTDMSLEEALES